MLPIFSRKLHRIFRPSLSRELKELYFAVGIQDLALAAILLFEPIYLYERGFSLQHILAYYIVCYSLYFIIIPFGGIFVAKRGPARGIMVSTFFLIGYYATFILIPSYRGLFWVAPVILALQKMFYWPAYHTDFIQTSDQGQRGEEFSGLWSLETAVYVIGPAIGGAIIKFFGFPTLFISVMAVILAANIPLLMQKIDHRPQSFSYWDSFCLPFRKIHIRSALAYMAVGEQLILLVIWPIFISITYHDFFSIGGIVALATLITAVYTIFIGRILDRGKWRQTLRWGGLLNIVVWATRPLIRSVTGVFLSDTAGRISQNTLYVTMTDVTYERALREPNLIERAMFFEQGLSLGKVVIAALIIIIAQWVPPFTAAFLLAGAMSGLYLLL